MGTRLMVNIIYVWRGSVLLLRNNIKIIIVYYIAIYSENIAHISV